MTRIGAANLRIGQTASLPGGVSVTFDGYKQWVALQVSHDPAQKYLLYAAAAMIMGLFASLIVKRRRVWVRLSIDATTGLLRLDMGGLGRTDGGDFAAEVDHSAHILRRVRDLRDLGLTIDLLNDPNVDAQQHVADVKRGELQLGCGAGSIDGGDGHSLRDLKKTLLKTETQWIDGRAKQAASGGDCSRPSNP